MAYEGLRIDESEIVNDDDDDGEEKKEEEEGIKIDASAVVHMETEAVMDSSGL